jgi:tetratricopeptide (TPR) repeat protein
VNRSSRASAQSYLGEARACLALDRAAQAEWALSKSIELNQSDPAPWLLRLGLLHVEDRTLEAGRLGWTAYAAVPPAARRDILRGLTLALLTDTPDELARDQLNRWIMADPADTDAQVALLSRVAAQPHAGDPDRPAQIASLTSLLARYPEHLAAREALVTALADMGETDRGREFLSTWPSQARDARYYRLRGRWDLDYEHHPAQAVEAFDRALTELPHDWRTHYRLSRALKMLGKDEQSEQEARVVTRLHEVLSPGPLGNRLANDFAHLDTPQSRLDLASLSTAVGLDRLADAWRLEAKNQASAADDPLSSDATLNSFAR